MVNLKPIKTQLIICLLFVALALAVKERGFTFLASLAIAILAAVLIESIILYITTKSIKITEGSEF